MQDKITDEAWRVIIEISLPDTQDDSVRIIDRPDILTALETLKMSKETAIEIKKIYDENTGYRIILERQDMESPEQLSD